MVKSAAKKPTTEAQSTENPQRFETRALPIRTNKCVQIEPWTVFGFSPNMQIGAPHQSNRCDVPKLSAHSQQAKRYLVAFAYTTATVEVASATASALYWELVLPPVL